MNRDDFSVLVLSYMEEIAAYARRLTRSAADADDLAQAAYERAFGAWTSLSDPAGCRAWLFRLTRNLHIDRVRATGARADLHVLDGAGARAHEPTMSAEAVERLDARELEAALSELPAEQREAVLLSDLWGFRYEEIATIADCPIGTVRSRIARGRAHLLTTLERRGAGAQSARGRR